MHKHDVYQACLAVHPIIKVFGGHFGPAFASQRVTTSRPTVDGFKAGATGCTEGGAVELLLL